MILGLQPSLNGPRASSAAMVCDAAPAGLFAPARPVMGRYDVCTSGGSIEQVLAAASGETHYGGIDEVGPLDAFGGGGGYNRSAMSRLYGGTRAKVARGWREEAGRFISTTLISPYPDATLTRLIAGTMEIRWTTDRPDGTEAVRDSIASHGAAHGRPSARALTAAAR